MTDRERRDCLHLRLAAVSRVVLFAIAIDPNIVRASISSTVTQEQFKKAVVIIITLPREGPIQPTKEDQVYPTKRDVNIP
ncbi:hypothetical protein BGW80DRAFT_1395142 [Lactifluus volemus]|nr:hypothetical protein BGW80DRAFT_1395142 [Lactifluus volemus]